MWMRIAFVNRSRAVCGAAILAMALLAGCAAPSPETPKPESDAVQAPAALSTKTSPPPTAATPAPKTATPSAPPSNAQAVPAPAPVDRSNDASDRLADKPPGLGAGKTGPSNPDRGCTTDSDCVVKDIGNCCGYFPACVNKNAKTDPAAVRAQCETSGMASICGFKDVKGCQCVQGRCEDSSGAVSM
jgi:hypothetical protein